MSETASVDLDSPLADRRRTMVGVIDIGSNSLRLVLYDRISRAPIVLFNEKVMCALGRSLNRTGRLDADGVVLARDNIERFVMLSRQLGVGRLDVLATSAVRDAEDGPSFVAEIEKRNNIKVTVVDGLREGRLSASGVLAGIPDADGITGDLGGGSVELAITGPQPSGFVVSLPIGPLRLLEAAGDPHTAIDKAIDGVPWLAQTAGKPFYAVGGAWRALARIHMEHNNYPLHVIQNYGIERHSAELFLGLIERQSRRSLEKIMGFSRKRLETVPLAAYVLAKLLNRIQPSQIIFSALGLREGHLYELLPAAEQRQDPLLAFATDMARANPRFGAGGDELVRWTDPLFPKETPDQRRLRRAASLLSDIGWNEHPDYRDQQVYMRCLRMPAPGLDHPGRAFIANVLHARYGGEIEAPELDCSRALLDEAVFLQARAVGHAFRLAYTLTGGAPGLLDRTAVAIEASGVALTVPEHTAIYTGEAVQRRLDALGRALGRRTFIRAEAPSRKRTG